MICRVKVAGFVLHDGRFQSAPFCLSRCVFLSCKLIACTRKSMKQFISNKLNWHLSVCESIGPIPSIVTSCRCTAPTAILGIIKSLCFQRVSLSVSTSIIVTALLIEMILPTAEYSDREFYCSAVLTTAAYPAQTPRKPSLVQFLPAITDRLGA